MAISALRLRPFIKALAIAVSIGSLPFVYLQVDARDGHLNALNRHVNANVKATASAIAVSPPRATAAGPSRSASPEARPPPRRRPSPPPRRWPSVGTGVGHRGCISARDGAGTLTFGAIV